MSKMIGIPRGLFYYKYNPLFYGFLDALGFDVVVSPPTNKEILNEGIRAANSETCLPTKTFIGHCLALSRMGVDQILVPRIVSTKRRCYSCPKFLGLPDVAKSCLKRSEGDSASSEILTCTVDYSKGKADWLTAFMELAERLQVSRKDAREAFQHALELQTRFEYLTAQKGILPPRAMEIILEGKAGSKEAESFVPRSQDLTVGVIGHPYNIYDRYTSLGLLDHLQELGCYVQTPDCIPPEVLEKMAAGLEKPMFWTFGSELFGAAVYLAERGVDGLVHLSVFGCGPDSFVEEIAARRLSRRTDIPLLFLNIDEHTAEAGLLTRIEAFTDMIRWRVKK